MAACAQGIVDSPQPSLRGAGRLLKHGQFFANPIFAEPIAAKIDFPGNLLNRFIERKNLALSRISVNESRTIETAACSRKDQLRFPNHSGLLPFSKGGFPRAATLLCRDPQASAPGRKTATK